MAGSCHRVGPCLAMTHSCKCLANSQPQCLLVYCANSSISFSIFWKIVQHVVSYVQHRMKHNYNIRPCPCNFGNMKYSHVNDSPEEDAQTI